MLGRDDEYVALLERAHRDYLDRDQRRAAAGCAWWIGHNLLFRGEAGPANGWFSVGNRLLEGVDCPERGYLLAPVWLRQLGAGELDAALATLDEAVRLGEAYGDRDLLWLARDDRARCLLLMGRVEEALGLVDEILVVLEAGEVSPVVRGIIYCNTIAFCRDAHQHRHARDWTEALTAWCEQQPQMVAHNGLCLVHRAEVLQLLGRWSGRSRRRARPSNGSPTGRSTRSPAVRRTTGRERSTDCRAGGRRPRRAISTRAATVMSRSPGSP